MIPDELLPSLTCTIHNLKSENLLSNDILTDKYFSHIYKNYYSSIHKIVRKILTDPDEIEDVMQICFLKVAKHLPHFDDAKGSLYTWMARIARNTALDRVKSSDFKKCMITDSFDFSNLFLQDNLQDQPRNIEIGITPILKLLNQKEREIIQLLYLKDYSQSEASFLLDIPIGTVKTVSRTAIIKLQKYCAQDIRYYKGLESINYH